MNGPMFAHAPMGFPMFGMSAQQVGPRPFPMFAVGMQGPQPQQDPRPSSLMAQPSQGEMLQALIRARLAARDIGAQQTHPIAFKGPAFVPSAEISFVETTDSSAESANEQASTSTP